METLHGKASAPSAGEREHVQPEPQDKTQGNTKKHLDLITFYQLDNTGLMSTWWCQCVDGFWLQTS